MTLLTRTRSYTQLRLAELTSILNKLPIRLGNANHELVLANEITQIMSELVVILFKFYKNTCFRPKRKRLLRLLLPSDIAFVGPALSKKIIENGRQA